MSKAKDLLDQMGEEHEHKWGPVENARFTGNPHRKCEISGCKAVSMDLDDDDEEEDD